MTVLARPRRHPAPWRALALVALVGLLAAGCSGPARYSVDQGSGTDPVLPPPDTGWLPTVNFAPARGWAAGQAPVPAAGLAVAAFASGLRHPRWLLVLPNGDVLVAETDAPPRPDDDNGLRGWVARQVMQRAGAGGPSANRITLLRDADGDGVAEQRSVLLAGLNSPFGMALVGSSLIVADTDALHRFPYTPGALAITAPGVLLAALPAGPINHHWTKSLLASADGRTLYVGVGSNSNVGERGLAAEQGRAAIWAVDVATGAHRVFASGLRNPVGLAWAGGGSTLWAVVNERDELGSDLVPDYLSTVREGDYFGWPHSWFGGHRDRRVQPARHDLVALARRPDYALGPHTASLGLADATGSRLGAAYAQGVFVGQHGSWNRQPPSGYRVVFVPFRGDRPSGALPVEVLGGFLDADGHALGRPVGVALDGRGALLVADDVGGVVWRVSARP